MPGGRHYYRTADVTGVNSGARHRIGRKARRVAKRRAPVLSGRLRRAIVWDVRRNLLRLGDLQRRVPYMRRQEFENARRRGFLRRGINSVLRDIEDARKQEAGGQLIALITPGDVPKLPMYRGVPIPSGGGVPIPSGGGVPIAIPSGGGVPIRYRIAGALAAVDKVSSVTSAVGCCWQCDLWSSAGGSRSG